MMDIREEFTSRTYSKAAGTIFISTAVYILGISCALASLFYACYYNIGWPVHDLRCNSTSSNFSGTCQHYCDSPQCVRSAQNLIAAMNTSVDPCEDFYNFACGNFARYKPIPEYKFRSNWFDLGTDLMLEHISTYLELNGSENDDPEPVLQAKLLYKQCLNIADQEEENFESVSTVLQNVGLPILPPLDQTSSNFSLLYSMTQSKVILDRDYFVSFGVYEDPETRSHYRLSLSKPSVDSSQSDDVHYNYILFHDLKRRRMEEPVENSHSHSTEEIKSFKKAFYEYASNVFELAYNNSTEKLWADVSDATLRTSISKLMKTDYFVYQMLSISHPSNDSVVPIIPMRMSVKTLQNMTDELWPEKSAVPKIIWEDYFRQILKDFPYSSELNFEDESLDAEIVVHNLFYIQTMLKWIAEKATPQELEMYMWWKTITTIAPYTSNRIRQYADNFHYSWTGIEPMPRNLHCANVVDSYYGMVTTLSLVNDEKDERNFYEISEIMENIESAFEERIKNISWMDNETKSMVVKKLYYMNSFIGYPPWLRNTLYLEGYYDIIYGKHVVREKNTFLDNILNLKMKTSANARKNFRPINVPGETTTRSNVLFSPTNPMDVNAYNMQTTNEIAIPIGILQFPFYGQGLQVLNYGAIGVTIGHEITHGFDNTGKEYDYKGRTGHSGWTNETLTEYRKRIQCIIDHYENFPEDDSSLVKTKPTAASSYQLPQRLKIGVRTLDENIADIGGLRNAFYAYRIYVSEHGSEPLLSELKQYTTEQLFFLAYANSECEAVHENHRYSAPTDEHSQQHVRVWGTLTNSKEFAKAWKCERGTRMNPSKNKCDDLW